MSVVARPETGARRLRSDLLWGVGAGALGAVVLVALPAGPAVPVVAVLGLGLVGLAIVRPKAFVILGLTAIVLTAVIERVGGAAAGNLDEAVVAIAAVVFTTRRLVTEGRIVWMRGTVPLLLFLAVGAASSIAAHVPASIALAAALLYLKAAVFGFALAQLRWSDRDLGVLLRAGAIAGVVTMVVALINLALPDLWSGITTGHGAGHVGPIPTLNGLFQHPAAMSRWCSLLAVGALVYLLVVRSSPFAIVLTVASSVIAVLTFEVKSLLGLIAAFVVVGLRSLRPLGVIATLCIGPIAIAVAGPPVVAMVSATLDEYVFQESARLRLTTGGAELAVQHFPLGAGLGRWGSSPAAEHYSPLYEARGFENVHGLSPRSPDFLNDTQWPAILGETGLVGAGLFLLALAIGAWSLIRPVGQQETVLQRWLRLAGLGWIFVLAVESIAAPVFVSTPSYPFLFLGVGIVASLRAERGPATPAPVEPIREDQPA